MNDIGLKDIFNKESIIQRARDFWHFKDETSKIKTGKKYEHLFGKNKSQMLPWTNDFDNLSPKQRILLIKGELIRTYDSLPNSDKTSLKNEMELSVFSSKWFKLPSKDKEKLLKYVI